MIARDPRVNPATDELGRMGTLDLARYPGGLTGIVRALCAGIDRRSDAGMLDRVRAYEGKTLAECRALDHDTQQSILDVRR